jgi:hypothetical protein
VDGLIDRDAVFKLLAADLWPQALTALGIDRPYRLASASSDQLKRDLRQALRRGRAIPDEAIPLMEARFAESDALPPIGTLGRPDPALVDRLQIDPAIDSGEAILFALLAADPETRVLLTGDKRAVTALRRVDPALFDRLRRRIVSLEACITSLIATLGIDTVRARTAPMRRLDQTLTIAFGSDGCADAATVTEALARYDPLVDA